MFLRICAGCTKKVLKSFIRIDDGRQVIQLDQPPEALSMQPRSTALTGQQMGALIVVGPKSMAAQLLCQHLGADSPKHWSEVDLQLLEPKTVVVIDGSLGTESPGIGQFVAKLHQNLIGVVVAFCGPQTLIKAQWIEYGAQACVGATASLDELGDAIRRVRSGEAVLGVSVKEGLLSELRNARQNSVQQTSLFDALTKREAGVLRELAQGKSPEDVAKTNYVSLNTIRTQIRGILAKLGTGSVVGAVALAFRSGWITPQQQQDPAY
jgi:DNA-binding NarL/FixJ family response regulator